MKIKLKSNGQFKEAIMTDDGKFLATMANGELRIYTRDMLISVEDESLDPESTTKQEARMPVFHYMQKVRENEDGTISTNRRMITNITLSDNQRDPAVHPIIVASGKNSILANYIESVRTRRPSNDIYAINTGTWIFPLLEWELIRNNKPFTLMIVSKEDMAKFTPAKIEGMVNRSSFAFANASYSFFLKTEQGGEWGLQALNMEIDSTKKAAKRLQEPVRSAEAHKVYLDGEGYEMKCPEFPEDDEIVHDGILYISPEVAIDAYRAIPKKQRRNHVIRDIRQGKMTRFTLRLTTPNGVWKVDAVASRNLPEGVDIMSAFLNLKGELRTMEDHHLVIWEHSPLHVAKHNMQQTGNFPLVFTKESIMHDIDRLVTKVEESLETEILPKFLEYGERAHTDTGTPDLEKLSTGVRLQHQEWQYHGLSPKAAANVLFMAYGGILNQMSASDQVYSKYTRTRYFKKLYIPMTNAIVGTVCTYESATKMGGFEFPSHTGREVFFDRRLGFVFPGNRFIQGFHHHGTWDSDDSITGKIVRIWSSGDIEMHRGTTIPEDMVIPTSIEEAREVGAFVRSPNGPGEITFEELSFYGGFTQALMEMDMYDPDNIITVDLAAMPLPQHVMLEAVDVSGLPEATTIYSGELMTMQDSMDMIFTQMKNPDVGAFCNAMMMWTAVAPGFPPRMLEVMGEIVDACQQGYDAAHFAAIAAEVDAIHTQVVNYVVSHPEVEVDVSTAIIRMPAAYQKKIVDRFVVGDATKIQEHYKAAIETIRTQVQMKTLQMRLNSDLRKALIPFNFGPGLAKWSEEFYGVYSTRLNWVDAEFKAVTHNSDGSPKKDIDPFTKMGAEYGKKLALEEVVAEMVTYFQNIADDEIRYQHIVGLYKWIARPDKASRLPLGRPDRIIFQSAAEGQLSLMHILIEGLYHFAIKDDYAVKQFLTLWTGLLGR